jgi:hypothetical protein
VRSLRAKYGPPKFDAKSLTSGCGHGCACSAYQHKNAQEQCQLCRSVLWRYEQAEEHADLFRQGLANIGELRRLNKALGTQDERPDNELRFDALAASGREEMLAENCFQVCPACGHKPVEMVAHLLNDE